MFEQELKKIPHLPGSYQMFNKDNIIIYVGKAKDLNRRVNSYFNRVHTGKTAKMVSEVDHFEYIVASSELEAFLLELNLIKKFDPKYNILLRDDKSYPYIEYIKEPYPELKVSRYLKIKKSDKKILFGPYPNAYAARRIVNLLNRLYPLRKCDNLGKKVCLYYHIGECLGYCEKKNNENIKQMEDEILSFLRGNDSVVKEKILSKIDKYNQELNFEASKELKEELDYINIIHEKQKMELHDFVNRDIINYYEHNGFVSIEVFFIRNGKLLGHFNDIFEYTFDVQDTFDTFIAKFYQKHEIPKEIIVPSDTNIELLSRLLETHIIIPEKGNKKQLLDLVYKNAKITLDNNIDKYLNELNKTEGANEELRKLLNLDQLYRIEAYDNSNLFGSYAVSGMVVFKDGKPSKNDYRKYKVSMDINDDYHTMQEILRRRFKKENPKSEYPDLIIADGGINQINAIQVVLDELNLNIPLCGLKKDNHHNTNVLINSNLDEIEIDCQSNLFHYLTSIQDEVHRFAITYHRTIRSKGMYESILEKVPGIGKSTKNKLLRAFKNITNIKKASIEELNQVVDKSKAENIYNYFRNNL